MIEDQKRSIASKNPAYAELWGLPGPVAGAHPQATVRNSPLLQLNAPPPPLPMCDHLGRGVGHCTLRVCEKGHGPNGQVKPCVACGPQCRDYSPDRLIEPVTHSKADIVIDQGASGIGDALQGLLAVSQLKADNPGKTVAYHVSPLAETFVTHFDGYDELGRSAHQHNEMPVRDALQMNIGYLRECQSHLQIARWVRYAMNIGASGIKMPSLREPLRMRELGTEFAGVVMLCPFASVTNREWPLHHWVTLEKLLNDAGYKTAVCHSDHQRSSRLTSFQRLIRESPEKVIGAFLNAAVIIGNDSGLSHLGAILGRPTVVLGGQMPAKRIFGCYPAVKCHEGLLACDGCCSQQVFDPTCRTLCLSQATITPQDVFMSVQEFHEPPAEVRSLLDDQRRATIKDCIEKTWGVHGDLAELGVFRGGIVKMMGETDPDARIRAFDTFTGIPEDDEHAEGHKKGDFATVFNEVKAYVNNPNVVWHVGKFPQTAPYDNEVYRVVHVDADTAQSTQAAIEYFTPRMAIGGFMIFDDYGWRMCPGVKLAVDAAYPPERIRQSTPTQAVVRF